MEDFILLEKMYNATVYIYTLLRQFPKSEKFSLGVDVRNECYKIIRLMIVANSKRNRFSELKEIDVSLGVLRYKIRLAKDLNFISIKKYGIISKKMAEVGKILGGLIKSHLRKG